MSATETKPVVEQPEPAAEEEAESKKRPSEAIGDSEATDGAASTKRQAIENPGTGEPEATGGGVAAVATKVSAPEPETEIRAIIGGKTAGSLIGRGGTVISFIRNESKCKVQISATIPQVDERIITVTGDVTGIFRAYSFIADKMRENEEANAERESRAAEEVMLKILIPHSVAGSIIGKQGAKIREIREATKAEVTIDKQMMPGSSERACTIKGTAEACAQTVFHIACTVIQVDVSGKPQYYTPGAAAAYGGYGGPPQPAYGHPQQYGGYQQQQQQQYGGYQQQGGYGQQQQQQQYGGHQGGGGGAGGGGGQTSHQIPIPSDYVGAIMGRGGAKIKEIRDLSRAQIKIQDNVPGLSERVITITGTPEGIQMAHYLIQTRMQEAMTEQAGRTA